MKTELSSENLDEFRQRFGTFHDAVIHQLHYEIFVPKHLQKVFVVVGTRDWAIQKEDKWINLTFEIEGVSNVIIKSSENHPISVIFKMSIGFFNREIFLDFFPSVHNLYNPKDYKEIPDDKGKCLVIVGRKCYFHISPYSKVEYGD